MWKLSAYSEAYNADCNEYERAVVTQDKPVSSHSMQVRPVTRPPDGAG